LEELGNVRFGSKADIARPHGSQNRTIARVTLLRLSFAISFRYRSNQGAWQNAATIGQDEEVI